MTRSLSPALATLPLADVRRLDAVRERLCHALRTADTLTDLRAYVAELASDIEGELIEEQAPDTVRHRQQWEDDRAPATPRDSTLGEEFGV